MLEEKVASGFSPGKENRMRLHAPANIRPDVRFRTFQINFELFQARTKAAQSASSAYPAVNDQHHFILHYDQKQQILRLCIWKFYDLFGYVEIYKDLLCAARR